MITKAMLAECFVNGWITTTKSFILYCCPTLLTQSRYWLRLRPLELEKKRWFLVLWFASSWPLYSLWQQLCYCHPQRQRQPPLQHLPDIQGINSRKNASHTMCNKGVHVYQSNGLVHVPIDLNYLLEQSHDWVLRCHPTGLKIWPTPM